MPLGWTGWRGWDGHCTFLGQKLGALVLSVARRFGARYINGDTLVKATIVEFAREKLLSTTKSPRLYDMDEAFVCLATRMPFDFDATNENAMRKQAMLVEKHMRLCLRVMPDIYSLETEAPSEPLLAEAAYETMLFTNLKPACVLSRYMATSGLSVGDRAEQVAVLLWLQAMDAARSRQGHSPTVVPLIGLLEEFFPEDADFRKSIPACSRPGENIALSEQFSESKVWFNHFVKVEDYSVLNREFLWRFVLRGAAILCANNQAGCDIVIPFVYRAGKLGKMNISAIIVQVKNDRRYSTKPKVSLFDDMNPFELNIFDVEDESKPLPIIRVVMALAAAGSAVHAREDRTSVQPQARGSLGPRPSKVAALQKIHTLATAQRSEAPKKKKVKPLTFTAYDFWFAGAKATTFGQIQEDDESAYDHILRVSRRQATKPGKNDVLQQQRLRLRAAKSAAKDHWLIVKDGAEEASVEFDPDAEYEEEDA
jgi:hypothetical protein